MKKQNTDMIEQTDILMSYWLAPGGTTVWSYERGGQLFVAAIMNGNRNLGIHFPQDSDRYRFDTVVRMFELLGFREVPVMKRWADVMNLPLGTYLREQWEIFEKHMQQAQAQANQPGPDASETPEKPASKIVSLTDK